MSVNPFADTLEEQDEQRPTPAANPFLETLDSQETARNQALRRATIAAHDQTPERAAQVRRLADRTGLATEVVERNYDDLSKRIKVEDTPYDRIQAETPKLAEWASDPSNNAIAKDDMEQLGLLEWIVSAPSKAFAQSVHQMRAAELRTQQLYRELTQEERDQLSSEKFAAEYGGKLGAGDNWFRGAVTGGSQLLANIVYGLKTIGPKAALGGAVGGVVGGVGGSFAGGVGAAPGAVAGAKFGAGVGATLGAAQFGFELEAGLALDEFLTFKDEQGRTIDPAVARGAAIAAGSLNAGLEVIGLGILARSIPGLDKLKGVAGRHAIREALRNPTVRQALGDAVRSYGGVLTGETLVEVAQRATTIVAGEAAKYVTDEAIERRTPGDILEDLVREGAAAVQGFAFVALPGPTIQLAHDAGRAQRATEAEAFFQALGEGVSQSKTVQAMPEAAQRFLEQATKDGPVESLYAPVDTFRTYWQTQGLDPEQVAAELTGDPTAFERALATGGDLKIPTAAYAVKVAGTEHHAYFAQELRLGPDEMNAREAAAFTESVKAALEAQAHAEAPAPTGAQQVRAAVLEELTGAGVPAATAEAYASLYEATFGSLAERAGIDPAQLYARYGLQVQRPDLQAGLETGRQMAPAAEAAQTAPISRQAAPGEAIAAPPVGEEGAALEAILGPGGFAGPERRETAGVSPTGEERRTALAPVPAGLDPNALARAEQEAGAPVMGRPGAAVAEMLRENPNVVKQAAALRARAAAARAPAPPRAAKPGIVDKITETGETAERTDAEGEAEPTAAPRGEQLPGAAQEPLATPGERDVARRRTLDRTREGAAQAVPASARATFDELLADARARGFSGTDDDLATRFLDLFEQARAVSQDLTDIADERSWRSLLSEISKAGGISVERESALKGELRAIMDNLAKSSGIIQKSGRTRFARQGQRMPLNSVGIEGAPGIIKARGAGMSVDLMREHLEQDPRWAHYAESDGLQQFVDDLEDASILGGRENRGESIDTIAPDTWSTLEGLYGVKVGADWWAAPTLDELAEQDADDTAFDVTEFEQPLTIAQMRERMAAHRAEVAGELEALGEVDGIRLVSSTGRGDIFIHRATQAGFEGKWQLTWFTADTKQPAGHEVYDTFADAYSSARGLRGDYGPSFGDRSYTVPITDLGQTLFDDLLEPPASPEQQALARKVDLETVATDEAMGVTFDEDGTSYLPNGEYAVNCTNCALRVIELAGNGVVVGWEEGTNPTAHVANTSHENAGHDFAIIDGRYLVDAWGKNVEMSTGRAVFDLESLEDRNEIRRLYGDPQTWIRLEGDKWIPWHPPQLEHVDVLDTGEQQPRLPGAGAIREQEVATPAFEAPFSLTSPVSKAKGKQTELFQSVFHGSPHIFEKFSLHAIGTGEGAQAYGWGLYFTSKKEIAEEYRKRLAGGATSPMLEIDGTRIFDPEIGLYYVQWEKAPATAEHREVWVATTKPQDPQIQMGLNELQARLYYRKPGAAVQVREELEKSVANLEGAHREGKPLMLRNIGAWEKATTDEERAAILADDLTHEQYILSEYKAALRVLDEYGEVLEMRGPVKPGRTYTVEIPEDTEYLMWDVPASQQPPKVQAALKALGVTWEPFKTKSLGQMRQWFNGPTAAALAREDIGIREALAEGYQHLVAEDETALKRWQYQHQGMFNQGNVDPLGESIYQSLAQRLAHERQAKNLDPHISWQLGPKMASEKLNGQGVAGIRYLDGFSRSQGIGTYNYVVFDENLVEITEFEQTGPRLAAIHQLSAENLKFAASIGGVAVPSIAVRPAGMGALKGYGEITLLGTFAHADPVTNPVFDADIWSATFPRPEYRKVAMKVVQKLVDRIRPYATKYDDRSLTDTVWDNAVNKARPDESINHLRRSNAGMAMFLETRGIVVEPVMVEAQSEVGFVRTAAFQRFLAETGGVEQLARHDYADTEYRKKLGAAIEAGIREFFASIDESEEAGVVEMTMRRTAGNWIDEEGMPPFGWTPRLERSLSAIGRMDVDTYATRERMTEALKGLEAEYQTWVDELILPMYGAPMLTVGRQKRPYSLPNIVEKMTASRSIKAQQEHLTFGEGKARASAAVRISSLQEMRNRAEWQIAPEEVIDADRTVAKQLLEEYRTAVLQHYTGEDWKGNVDVWNGLDASMRAIARWSKGGRSAANLRSALAREGFRNVPADVLELGVKAGKAFMQAPVPYFESKPQRAVQLEEFPGAVIPSTADEATREILEQAGVEIAEYDPADPSSRDAAIARLQADLQAKGKDVLFAPERRGSIRFGADRQMTITLLERADLSTFLHESGHFFLEVMSDLFDRVVAQDPAQLSVEQKQLLVDYGATLEWLGVDDRAKLGVSHHEQFARAFEAYLMEGKAPTLELQSVFSKFRAWLVGIYRTLRGLDVNLTNEVRAVFDRMLASDRALAEAAAVGRVEPMFATPADAGMSAEEFALYRATVTTASRTAREELDRRLLSEVQREREAQWKARRAEIFAEVAAEIHKQPTYRALAAMRTGTAPDGSSLFEGETPEPLKLSRELLVERFGKERLKRLPKPYIYSVKGGLDPDSVAETFGFSSADEMLTAIEQAAPMRQVIEQATDQRMLQEQGSLLLDGTLLEEAQAALSNEDRELVIRAELRALARLRRQVDPFVKAERAKGREAVKAEREKTGAAEAEVSRLKAKARSGAASIRAAVPPANTFRDAARARVAKMKVRELKPAEFWSASRRAATKALESAARQEFDAAITAKQQELLNLALYREAMRARADVDARVKAARDLARPSARQRLGLAGEAYLDQVDGILDRYSFARVSQKALDRRASLAKFIAALEGEGLPVDLPEELLEEHRRIPYQEISYEELVGVTDGLQQIVHLARLKNRLLKNKEQRELQQVADTLVQSIRDNARRAPGELARDRRPSEERRRAIGDFFAGHRKLASMLRELDGFQDGGPAWEAIMRPLNDAGAREAEMNADATRQFAELVERAFPGAQKRRLYDKLHIPAIARSLSRMERIMVAANWGNDGNRDRIRRAEGWTDDQVQAILDTLSGGELQFVQGVFDLIDGYWSEIEAKQQRVYGVAPAKVEAVEIRAAGGTIKGGYFPLKYDDRLSASAIAALDLESANLARQAAYAQATTKRGHTKERVARVKLPVRFDFGVIFEHVQQVIHDLAHHETLIDVGRILGHREVQAAILETQGDLVYKQIRNTIRDVAFGDVPAVNGFERAVNHVRMGATVAGLGWNLSVSLLQPIGLTNAVVRIGPRWVARGLSRWLRHPTTMVETVRWIEDLSPFMRARGRTMQREINEIRNQVGVETGSFKGWVDEVFRATTFDHVTRQGIADSYFWMIQQAQRLADVPTWLGAYEKAMAGGETEARAVALADQAVLDSQGGGQIKDLAQVQRGGPMMRLWTNFYSYFNVVYNQASESRRRTRLKHPAEIGRLASDYFMLFIAPATLGFILREAFRSRGDDDEDWGEWAERLAFENAGYIAGTMLGLREVSGVLAGAFGYEGPAGARAFASLARLGQQVRQGETDAAFWRALNDVAGVIFHYPAGQVSKSVSGAAALAEGKTENPGALVAGAPRER